MVPFPFFPGSATYYSHPPCSPRMCTREEGCEHLICLARNMQHSFFTSEVMLKRYLIWTRYQLQSSTLSPMQLMKISSTVFMCFEILRSYLRGACRPIIGVDGTFLKVAVKWYILAAVGHNANNQIYPLAWSVVKSETKDNLLWFIKQLKSDLVIEDGSRFVNILDQSKVIYWLIFWFSHSIPSV